ncbi:MAG: hypothetical protein NUW00_04900 [Candidatus Kaiserbacteria bacterium]|nr:hypothetical protein [Candidatus Kaiserbacteria bacterium]MCR4330915.1 hypothetical protein [Patescibacteria group bacterium]
MGIDYESGAQLGFKFSAEELSGKFRDDSGDLVFGCEIYTSVEDLVEAISADVGATYFVCGSYYDDDECEFEFIIGPVMPAKKNGGGYTLKSLVSCKAACTKIKSKLKKLGLKTGGGPLLHVTWLIC